MERRFESKSDQYKSSGTFFSSSHLFHIPSEFSIPTFGNGKIKSVRPGALVGAKPGVGRVWTLLLWYVCMCICMVITYSRVWINRVWLPILLVRGQLNRENYVVVFFPFPRSGLRIQSRETSSAVPSRVSSLILHTPRLNLVLVTDSSHSYRFPRRRPYKYC